MPRISLLAWSKKFGVVYSQAQKMIQRGQITAEKVRGRVLIDENHLPPQEQRIRCAICGASLSQITNSHLRLHLLTIDSYKLGFPDAPIVSDQVSSSISKAITGSVRSQENRDAISAGRKGIIPKDHPRFVVGAYKPSEATKQLMSASHIGKTHTENAKRKIGDAHRGKTITQSHIERKTATLLRRIAAGEVVPAFTGRNHHEKTKAALSRGQRDYWASLSSLEKAERIRIRSEALRGIKRTPEQKVRYRAATLKRMEERPNTVPIFKDTGLEKDFEKWCIENEIVYQAQFFLGFEGERHPYDFYLPDFNILVECDGPHHWRATWFTPLNGNTHEEEFAAQQVKDAFWSRAAIELGYTLVRLQGISKVGDNGTGSIKEQMEQWLEEQPTEEE